MARSSFENSSNDGIPIIAARRIPYDFHGIEPFRVTVQPKLPKWLNFIGFVPFIGIPLLAFQISQSLGLHWPSTVLLVFIAIISGAKCGIQITIWSVRKTYRKRAVLDRQNLQPNQGAISVGISFAKEICFFQGNSNWDRGFIEVSEGKVTFRGFSNNFELPSKAIEGVTIAKANVGTLKLPRVFVSWQHPDSGLNVFSLEIFGERDHEECVRKSTLLLRIIESQIGIECPQKFETSYPFESRKLDFDHLPLTEPDAP